MNPLIPFLRYTWTERVKQFLGVPHIEFYPDGRVLYSQRDTSAWPSDIDAFGMLLTDYVKHNKWLRQEYEEYWEMMHESY